jgi:hypothetical protein
MEPISENTLLQIVHRSPSETVTVYHGVRLDIKKESFEPVKFIRVDKDLGCIPGKKIEPLNTVLFFSADAAIVYLQRAYKEKINELQEKHDKLDNVRKEQADKRER